ncbi:MAG: DUF1702 family protein [Phycisphaerae bacterium]
MLNALAILFVALMPLAVWALATGTWRRLLSVFCIRTSEMTVAKLGLQVSRPRDVARVNGVLANFAAGFNKMVTARNDEEWRSYLDSLPVIFQPFAHEGAAMGYELRRLFGFATWPVRLGADGKAFERDIVRPEPGMRYLYYVGLGFWSGMKNESPKSVQRKARELDALHQYLLFDGYGFKIAFFDQPTDPGALKKLDTFDGYARHAAYQGVGRALYFRHMDSVETLIERVRDLGVHDIDAAAGLGLASVFVNPDRLDMAQELGRQLPEAWQPHFQLGMCFALKARIINDPVRFDEFMENVSKDVRDAALASIRECDRAELQIRSEATTNGYREWRKRVTAWMSQHVEFPMAAMQTSASVAGDSSIDWTNDEEKPKAIKHAEVRNDDQF